MPLFSHYGDVPDRSDQLALPALVFCIITPLFITARLISRLTSVGRLGPDDWVIIVSAVLAEVVSIQMIVVCEWAFGKHATDVSPASLSKTMELYFYAQILYKISIGLTKISILLLYLRIFMIRWFEILCYIWIAIISAFSLGSVFSSIFQCTPVEFAFKKKIPGGGTCINLTAFWYANAAFNILSDLVVFALPIFVIRKLHLPTRKKVLLCCIFTVGIFVCVTSILRITTLNIATSHLDTPWNNIPSSMWTVIEENLGIICACLPTLRHIVASVLPCISGRDGTRETPVYKGWYSSSRATSRQQRSGNSRRSRVTAASSDNGDLRYNHEMGDIMDEHPQDGPDRRNFYSKKHRDESQERIIDPEHGSRDVPAGADTGITRTVDVYVKYDQSHDKYLQKMKEMHYMGRKQSGESG